MGKKPLAPDVYPRKDEVMLIFTAEADCQMRFIILLFTQNIFKLGVMDYARLRWL